MVKDAIKTSETASGRRRLLLLMPFLIVFAFVILAFFRISALKIAGTADEIPNALQGRPAPRLHIPLLYTEAHNGKSAAGDEQFFDSNQLKGQISLVNFWGSWCPPCREEHPFLMSLANNAAFQLVGVNYKDSRENAERFLGNFGNPFRQIGFDKNGRAAIDWGVYGPPETFVLDKNGIILYRFVGPMNTESFREKIRPVIIRANAG